MQTRPHWDDLTRSTDSLVDIGQQYVWYLNLPARGPRPAPRELADQPRRFADGRGRRSGQ
jgi:hypothetical protein